MNPESEKSGVLSSCEALATNSRRARSSLTWLVTSRSTMIEATSASSLVG